MLARGLALGAVLGAVLAPSFLRKTAVTARSCAEEGRGVPPRHWLGCRGDPGAPRDLAAEERLVLGLPVDLNAADERALAFVPGLSRRLARAVVEHRVASGPFRTVDGILAVKGIGPRRLERARPRLVVNGAP